MPFIHFIGVDASKEWFDAARDGDGAKPQRFPNSSAGFAAFSEHYAAFLPSAPSGQVLVVLEATGGYETALVCHLAAQGVALHKAQPLQAKNFIRSLGQKGKTDALDARGLARYGRERHESLSLYTPPSAEQRHITTLMMRRADLVAMRVQERNRLQHPNYAGIANEVQDMIDVLDAKINALEQQLETTIAASQTLRERAKVLLDIKGFGPKVVPALLAFMPELGTLTRRTAASLAGCAPHPRDSGKTARYRQTFGGRATVRRMLFVAAMAARRHDPTMKAFFNRLIENGKKKMVALMAVMRKLITIANARLRENMCHNQPQQGR